MFRKDGISRRGFKAYRLICNYALRSLCKVPSLRSLNYWSALSAVVDVVMVGGVGDHCEIVLCFFNAGVQWVCFVAVT